MRTHTLITSIAALVMMLLTLAAVSGAEPAGADVSNTADLGQLPDIAAGNLSVEAGNITITNLATNQSTLRWAGLLGNATGTIILGDSSNNAFYQWAARGNLIFATTGAPTWSNLSNVTEANVTAQLPHLAAGSNDAYNETFTNGPEDIGSVIFSINATYALTQSAGSTQWKTYALWDGTSLIFAGKVIEDGTSYHNQTVDFQMILPEDGTGGDSTATLYNLYMENK